jgi:4-hydroxybenzoyl-CoA reductase subunit beta
MGEGFLLMIKSTFFYETPESLDRAYHALTTREGVTILAGGTDLIPLIKYGVKKPSCLLDLKNIPSLKSITQKESSLLIGSMVTLSEIAKHPLVNRYCPALAQSARSVASPQIRNVATLAGNLLQERRCFYFNQSEYWRKGVPACIKLGGEVCHQIPNSTTCRALYYSDTAPTLLAFDAWVERYDGDNTVVVPLREMIHRHVPGGNEKQLLTGILLPIPPEGTWGRFMKYGVRAAIDFATINVALRFSPACPGARQSPTVKIFVGALSPEPVELNETAKFLTTNFSERSSLRGEIEERARKEASAKSALIRETGVSLQSKRNAFDITSQIVGELLTFLAAA